MVHLKCVESKSHVVFFPQNLKFVLMEEFL